MNKSYRIRPAGRHIFTIGKDLIKDKYAAIVELVKNAYDADASFCRVSLLPFNDKGTKGIKVIITDDGHGMSFQTVTEKWMVPSTNDKFKRNTSPSGRKMQGKKGIGRYSASILGDKLLLSSIDDNRLKTTLTLDWNDFKTAKFLDDVYVEIVNQKSIESRGTQIKLIGNDRHLFEWNEKQLKNLKSELKKLVPPKEKNIDINNDDNFDIYLELGDFPYPKYSNIHEKIDPYPLFKLFDYRISGSISEKGNLNLIYENKRTKDLPEELSPIEVILNKDSQKDYQAFCGNVNFDFRVFDRDPSSIDTLIERGLKDPITGESVGKREARIILDTYNGIGVYREGFRLRPLGDAGYDWLSLDNERVQNPSLRIGSDQIIGFIHIENENKSGLEEKSARDGLKETAEYFGLIEISKIVLRELESRRFAYRQKVGLGRNYRQINSKIERLFDFKDLEKKINSELSKIGIDQNKIYKISKIITDKEKKNNKIANELKQIIALYQGHATVGKIINVVMHEGRKPLGYFNNQIPNIKEWIDELNNNFDKDLLNKILTRINGVLEQSHILTDLFNKLDPLSAKRKVNKKDFKIIEVIESVKNIFNMQLDEQNISYSIDCDINHYVYGWKDDFYIVLTNLVENSIYWLRNDTQEIKNIDIKVYDKDNSTVIEYRDNGPGIEKDLIESEIIFEPEFSNKVSGGTGLGLAISGEAIDRNNGTLKAIYSTCGAYFKIEVKGE